MSAVAGDGNALRPSALRTRLFGPYARKIIAPVLFISGVLIVWEVWLRIWPRSRAVIVPPSSIFAMIRDSFDLLMMHAWSTLTEIVIGFVISAAVGIALGTLITMSKWSRQAFYPNILFFQLIPKAAVAPLFILWLGFGTSSRVTFAVFMSFFPIALATATGLENTRPDTIRLCRALTATPWQTFIRVRFPFAMPHIFAGLKVGMTMSMIGIIVGEFISAQQGLGYVIMFASSAGESAPLYAALLLLAILGIGLYACVLLAEMAAKRWYRAPFVSDGFA
jgi:NitT/TauT family transport system permease protein